MWARRVVQLVLLILVATLSSSSLPADEFEEIMPDSITAANPIDTVTTIAVYACWDSADSTVLPWWWEDIWDSTKQHSVPRYYSETSWEKHELRCYAVGRDSTHCFTSPFNPNSSSERISFTLDIFAEADSFVDFALYDNDGPNGIPAKYDTHEADDDGYVDELFFMICYGGPGTWGWNRLYASYTTNDSSGAGQEIKILNGTTSSFGNSLYHAMGIATHEYGHRFVPFNMRPFKYPVKGHGLGSFDLMAYCLGFEGIPSPLNPWFRSKWGSALNWIKTDVVTSTTLSQPIHDIATSDSGNVYELISDLITEPSMSGQSFLVSNHQRYSFWEQRWPDRGLMIWHVFDNSSASGTDSRRKLVDIETANGLWDWWFDPPLPETLPDSGHAVSPNPVAGIDSLDVFATGYMGGKGCMYRDGVDSVFDAFSNPSSDEYHIDSTRDPVSMQYIASHVAVRNIQKDATNPEIMRADLIVNRVESDAAVATGQNNARRWLPGLATDTMHLVYSSKGYIYHTATDSNKIWLPAIPIGEGSYPALSFDTTGNPAVVWVQEGVCGLKPSRFMFSRKTGGGWTTPDTLLCVSTGLGPPSFVIDTLNSGHIAYKVGLCLQNGNAEIHYGTFDVSSPTLQDTTLDASEISCGNASIGYSYDLNSVHVVWEKESRIWHNWKDDTTSGSGWHTPSRVSASQDSVAKTPSIDVQPDTVHVIWASKVRTGKDIIRYRRRTGSIWGNISSPSDTNLTTARQPVVVSGSGGLFAVWAEVPTGYTHSDIIYAKWDSLGWQRMGNFCTNPVTDDYPQALQRRVAGVGNPTGLDVVWTNGNSLPFCIANSVAVSGGRGGGGGQSGALRLGIPKVFALKHPFPSPFSTTATIKYQVPYPSRVSLRIYDLTGRLVNTLIDGSAKPGYHTVIWKGTDSSNRDVSNGVYFVRFESPELKTTEKMVFLR